MHCNQEYLRWIQRKPGSIKAFFFSKDSPDQGMTDGTIVKSLNSMEDQPGRRTTQSSRRQKN